MTDPEARPTSQPQPASQPVPGERPPPGQEHLVPPGQEHPAPPDQECPASPDPWKGFRGVMAATLILESIVVLLTLLVLTKIGDNGGPLGVGLVLALAAAMIYATRLLSKPWAIGLALALQAAMIATGLLVGALGALGVLFGLVWLALLLMRRDVAGKLARGELPSQRR